jgi:photosystem II stability/assembly factor-like uncharacterized protein
MVLPMYCLLLFLFVSFCGSNSVSDNQAMEGFAAVVPKPLSTNMFRLKNEQPAYLWRRCNVSISLKWSSLASDYSGSVLIATEQSEGGVYKSSDYGKSWVKQFQPSPVVQWVGVASDATGTHYLAAQRDGSLFISSNAGVSWTVANIPSQAWTGVACDDSGKYMVATADSSSKRKDGGIYSSNDFGETWQLTSAEAGSWVDIASSSDGSVIFAVQFGAGVFKSSNRGANWVPTTIPSDLIWSDIAMDRTGGFYLSLRVDCKI